MLSEKMANDHDFSVTVEITSYKFSTSKTGQFNFDDLYLLTSACKKEKVSYYKYALIL